MPSYTSGPLLHSAKMEQPLMPSATPAATALQGNDPQILLECISLDEAKIVLDEWRQSRASPNFPKAKQKTQSLYRDNTRMLEHRYCRESDVEIGTLSPLEIVKQLLLHCRNLSTATWKLYRASFLFALNERELDFRLREMAQSSLIRALAVLIVTTKKPYADTGIPAVRPFRTKSISSANLDRLINHLATGYPMHNRIARLAQSFALATIVTGFRPAEWASATIRPAAADEVPADKKPESWIAIEVDTSKRKDVEPIWKRTVLVGPGIYQIHCRLHHEQMLSFIEESTAVDPVRTFIRRCSSALSTACKALWNKPVRGKPPLRITLYTLRHQARANVAAAYGGFVAAALMGHSPRKGESWYAGKHRANTRTRAGKSPKDGIPVPLPGKDVLAKADEFAGTVQQFTIVPELPDEESDAL